MADKKKPTWRSRLREWIERHRSDYWAPLTAEDYERYGPDPFRAMDEH